MKVIAFTRGDLTGRLGRENQQSVQRCTAEQSGVSRRHSTVPPKAGWEGQNVKGSMRPTRLMSDVKKADKSIPEWNYQREVGVELRDNAGERSIAIASAGGKDEGKLNPLRTAVCRTARTVV